MITRSTRAVETPAGLPERLAVPLGDDLDGAVDRLDGGLIVDRVCRHRYAGGPFLDVGERRVRHVLALEMRKHRKIDQPERLIAGGQRIALVVGGSSEVGSR